MRRSIVVVIISAIIALSGVLIVVYGFNIFSADYNLEIDPLKDEQNLFRTASSHTIKYRKASSNQRSNKLWWRERDRVSGINFTRTENAVISARKRPA